jgi:hypothetical protein
VNELKQGESFYFFALRLLRFDALSRRTMALRFFFFSGLVCFLVLCNWFFGKVLLGNMLSRNSLERSLKLHFVLSISVVVTPRLIWFDA